MKKCAKCQEIKAPEDFAKHAGRADGLQTYCRECQTLWAREKYHSSPLRKEIVVARNTRLRNRNKAEIENYLKDKSCLDCGDKRVPVLTFDHRAGEIKRATVSDMVLHGYSLESIYAEIAKCDIRCFNCHMIKDSQRRGGLKWRGSNIALAA